MKLRKRGVTWVLSVLLTMVLTTSVFAEEAAPAVVVPDQNPETEEALQVKLDQYTAEDGLLKLYLNHNRGADFRVEPENVKILFGANEMEANGVKTLQEDGTPVSYRCMVDVSGSMSQNRIDEAKTIIKDLAAKKKPGDTISITTMGNELVSTPFLSDPAEINTAVDALTLTKEDTNLYYGIVQELEALKTSNDVARKRCLLIFSDGADDQATGITQGEAETAVRESHIPVFTVGLLKSADNENAREMAKLLGSFARMSSGGKHFAPALSDGTDETIAPSIMDAINSSLVVTSDLSDCDVSGKEVALKVSVSDAAGETAEDSVNVPESEIKIIQAEVEKLEALAPAPAPEPETEVEEVPQEKMILGLPAKTFYLIIAIVAIAAVAAFLLLFLFLRKKQQSDNNPAMDHGSEGMQFGGGMQDGLSVTQGMPDGVAFGGIAAGSGESKTVGLDSAAADASANAAGNKSYKITLFCMGKGEEKSYDLTLKDPITIGRSASKSSLVIKDTALSGLHCTILGKDGMVMIKDEGSTNGTFVNGVPIEGNFELHQDDIILLGSYEYRITWK
ncbi:MAG: FHA domain-containing protein [Lachnospiraceae bacterium]|nr:FHA domain-containing protein [Lachnospiraceae bacterium]